MRRAAVAQETKLANLEFHASFFGHHRHPKATTQVSATQTTGTSKEDCLLILVVAMDVVVVVVFLLLLTLFCL